MHDIITSSNHLFLLIEFHITDTDCYAHTIATIFVNGTFSFVTPHHVTHTCACTHTRVSTHHTLSNHRHLHKQQDLTFHSRGWLQLVSRNGSCFSLLAVWADMMVTLHLPPQRLHLVVWRFRHYRISKNELKQCPIQAEW